MGIQVNTADTRSGGNKNRFFAGLHNCVITNLRQWNDPQYGRAFAIDLETLDGPHGAGYPVSLPVFPDSAKGGGRMTPVMARAKEEGKCVKMVAAAYGLYNHEAEKVTQTAMDAAVMEAGPGGKFPVTPLAGRKIVIKGISRPNGKDPAPGVDPRTAYYCETHPHEDVIAIANGSSPAPASAPIPAPVSIPTPPSAPPAAPTFPPEGWTQHPSNPQYFYCGQEVLTADDLRKRAA